MGQQSAMRHVGRVAPMPPGDFYERHVAGSQPVLLAGVAADALGGTEWDDRFLESRCLTERGTPWRATIEAYKVIVSNTRWPLLLEWTFCDFVRNYSTPAHSDGLYCVSPLTDPDVQLGRDAQLPSVLGCSEVHESVHDARLWMSSGGTSSSLHFDTHENLMLQVDGSKSVYFWPASESHLLYMDHHNRFGLSPAHPDHVDLDKYPLFGAARGGRVARLRAGDALFIPDGWWHQVRTWPGRNVAITFEFEPYEGLEALWPANGGEGHLTFRHYLQAGKWSEQARIKYRNKQLVTARGGPIRCAEAVRATADSFKCSDNHASAERCNFECAPQACVTRQLAEKQRAAAL